MLCDGKHIENIKARRSKGIGVVNEMISVLDDLSLGPYYFSIAMILRQAMLISVLLFNAETWLRLTKNNVAQLEKVDEMLLRKLLKTPSSTPIASLYLETGSVPLRYVIKGKRIMFLQHIITRNEESLISRVLQAQINNPVKGDWWLVVKEDLKILGMESMGLKEIREISKDALRKLLKDRINDTALQDLEAIRSSRSKL